ncbi:MAG TPA: wax ester/triacylglycerol synthase family O-acyltransferase [Solirubrobacteraceae bacterium]|jgi:WS/DGAT/MGAT family acyltransferase|nr:wax ester/triacylglycerol synthase family O-acyltransferase [Solirubrobacteraceae bacterium]
MRQLTSLDAQFLAMESPSTYGHVSGLAIYDPSTRPGGKLELKDVCRLVGERIHMLPPFRWKLVEVPFGLDLPYWVEDPDFDLDFHIRESAVPPPGNKRQLAETVARIVARPLDRARPLWELYVIHGIEGGRYVGLLTKVHHAAVDGVSGAEILGALVDLSPEGRELPPRGDDVFGEREPSQWEMLGRGLLGVPRQPLRAARAVPATVPNLPELPGAQLLPGMGTLGRVTTAVKRRLDGGGDGEVLDPQSLSVPRTFFNQRISPHRRFSFDSLPLERVKAVKNELGITVNDVVVAACATGVREWLLELGELPDEPLVAMVPVSVRKPEEAGTFGNRVSVMIVPIPTDEPDPRRRLMRAHETLAAAKTRHRALPASILQDATQFVPPALFSRAARVIAQVSAGVQPPLNLVISNVPGPPVPLFLAGAKLVAHYPVSVITDGVGLNITCLSYLDHVDFGIVADRELIDDAWPLMNAIRSGLADLDAVVCGGRTEPARPRGRAERQKLPAT